MQHKKFRELCAAIRCTWTSKGGAVALLRSKHVVPRTFRLCIGITDNVGLMAEHCVLWRCSDGTKLYDGALVAETLRHILTEYNVCSALVTRTKGLLYATEKAYICLGNRTCCRIRTCRLSPAYVKEGRRCSTRSCSKP